MREERVQFRLFALVDLGNGEFLIVSVMGT